MSWVCLQDVDIEHGGVSDVCLSRQWWVKCQQIKNQRDRKDLGLPNDLKKPDGS